MESRVVTVAYIICIACCLIIMSSEGCMHTITWENRPDLGEYSVWANNTNFTVNYDSIQFFFPFESELSALLVSEEDYRSCNTKNPVKTYKSANSDDLLRLNRTGYYYFIGGIDGSCQKGLKMSPLVKELQPDQPVPPPGQNDSLCGLL